MFERIKNRIDFHLQRYADRQRITHYLKTQTRPPEKKIIEDYLAAAKPVVEGVAGKLNCRIHWGALSIEIHNKMLHHREDRIRHNINMSSDSSLDFILEWPRRIPAEKQKDLLGKKIEVEMQTIKGRILIENTPVHIQVQIVLNPFSDLNITGRDHGPLDLLMTEKKRWGQHLNWLSTSSQMLMYLPNNHEAMYRAFRNATAPGKDGKVRLEFDGLSLIP